MRKMVYSTLICPNCGCKMRIPRFKNRQRPEGHIKTMFCGICRKEVDFIENNYERMDGVCREAKEEESVRKLTTIL